MGTPLKSLSAILSPRLLTPKSPKIWLNVPKSTQFLNVKSRDFCKNTTRVSKNLFVENCTSSVQNAHNFLINTPNKNDLLKEGTRNKILNVLGKGTFGTVFKATFKEKTVAAKVVNKKCAENEQNALQLNHKNVVKIFEIIKNDREKYALIIMEYLKDSNDLQCLLNKEGCIFSFDTTLNFAKNITSGLIYCHKKDILHLDIKPKNILVCGNLCKICDFGNSIKTSDINSCFQHKGTIAYTAPEILLGKKPSKKSDIYSLGIVFWQLIFRKRPYQEIDSNEAIIYQVVKCGLRPKCQGIMDKFEKLYQKCWDFNETERPEAVEVLEGLEQI